MATTIKEFLEKIPEEAQKEMFEELKTKYDKNQPKSKEATKEEVSKVLDMLMPEYRNK